MELKLLLAVCLCALYKETEGAVGAWTVPGATDTISLNEDQAINGDTTITFAAANGNTYTLVSETPSDGTFAVASTGALTITKALDYEAQSSRTLVVRATETSTSDTDDKTVTVNIVDKNDNTPTFAEVKYIGNVAGGACTGTNLGSYAATDADGTSANNVITYTIPEGNTGDIFTMSTSGIITIAEGKSVTTSSAVYSLKIVATDSGTPALSSSTTLSLYVCGSGSAGLVVSLLTLFIGLLVSMK